MQQADEFNIAHIEPVSHIYGPGRRFVVWFQGCTLACRGCWNMRMWPHSPNTLIHRQTLLEQMLTTDGLTGITLLGGEPLQQPRNTLWLLQRAKEFDLDVMLYSGYSLDEITADPGLSAVLGLVDILVAGRYEQDLRNINLRWRGSENQQVLFLSERYSDTTLAEANEVEVIIDSQGAVTVLGYPSSKVPLLIIDG